MRPSNILPTHILVRYVTVFLWASFKFWNMRCQDGLSYWDTYTIVAAIPGTTHAISMATLLLSSADHAGGRSLVRTVAISSNLTFFITNTGISLAKILPFLVGNSMLEA